MMNTITNKNKFNFLLLSLSFLTFTSCDAKDYNGITELINKETGINTTRVSTKPIRKKVTKKEVKKVILKKNKNGNFIATWEILSEYNLEKKQAGINLKKLINNNISIQGFMIPLDYSSKNIKEFLLVPYMPNCAHVPPPPANMIISVNVKGKKGITPSYSVVEVTGKLKVVQLKGEPDPYMPEGVFSMTTSSIKEVKL